MREHRVFGVYGLEKSIEKQNKCIYYEQSILPNPPSDFLSEVGQAWEAPLNNACKEGLRITRLRFGVILGSSGGMLSKLIMLFKFGFGGRVGTGKQFR